MAGPPQKSLKRKSKDAPKRSNTVKKSNDKAVRDAPAVPQIEDDVPDFPRGGASSLSRREEAEVRAEVDAEFAAELRESKSRNKRHKRDSGADDDFGSLFGDGLTGKLPKFANKITLKNVSPGMKLWGVISEVNEKDLVVGLPGGLRGLVRAEEASDLISENDIKDSYGSFLSSIFHVGQLVSCVVMQVDDDRVEGKGRKKIWLSLRLALLNKGFTLDAIQEGTVMIAYVKSIEDRGCILHFGASSFTGFLPRKDKDGGGIKLNTGQILQGVVKSIDKARRVVYLSSDSDLVSKCVTKDIKGISIDLLVPGMMVNARVHTTLENGILLSFLTYFTGTVDIYHLQDAFPTRTWKDDYNQNKKVNARILFIDPSSRAVGLTMNPHLVHNKAPPSHVKTGEIYDSSPVIRVDKGQGLLLEIPSSPVSTPAYVSIFDVSDEEIRKLEKKFKEGNRVRVRVLGFRHLEGMAMGVLKASALEGEFFTHSDVKPGMVVKAKVLAVESFGAIVQLSTGVKALCPLPHMSEFDISKPRKKFKVGVELPFRVLGCKSKRITVTHKKTLLKSKLDILSSYAEATEGLVTHGWITKIEKHGCFVRFYNGVQGFAPRSELGLEPGTEASTMYHVGQVVKCRVISAIPASRKINISFIMSSKRPSLEDTVKLGSLVSGVIEQITPEGVRVHVNGKGDWKGTISNEHLADHQVHTSLMKSVLQPGHEFDQLLVLDFSGSCLILSAKYSLINSVTQLPMDVAQVHPNSLVHGYIFGLTRNTCYVRFLGRLTGSSRKREALNDQGIDISEAYYVGQSVRGHVLNVDSDASRKGKAEGITLSLKQSSCFSTDASFIQEYFIMEDKIAKMQISDSSSTDLWVEKFELGSIKKGKVQQIFDSGAVGLSFENLNVCGFVSHYQCGAKVELGSVVRAAVLDINKTDPVVDLSLKLEFVREVKQDGSDEITSKKKRKRDISLELELHQTVDAVVEIVKEKERYLVLSIPAFSHAIGYASMIDYNTQKLPVKQFVDGQTVVATVEALPGPLTGGRLLLLLKSLSEAIETSKSKRAKKNSSYSVGSIVEAEITEIKPLELQLKFGLGFSGRVHITEANDDHSVEGPFSEFRIGQRIKAKIIEEANRSEKNKKYSQWELTIRPSSLSGSQDMENNHMGEESRYSIGKGITGYVVKADNEWVLLAITRHVKAKLYVLDSSSEPNELIEFQKRFTVGKSVTGYIIGINKEKNLLRMILHPLSAVSKGHSDQDSFENVIEHIHEGDTICGRISKIQSGVGGMLVQIGPHLYGKVHYTELTDAWVPNPLLGYQEGQFVKCKVLEINHSATGTMRCELSLRSLEEAKTLRSLGYYKDTDPSSKRFEKIEDLHPDMVITGYVKNVMSKGCFIMLSRKIDAKILLSNLSNGFIQDPVKEFPIGKLVTGKVLSVEHLSKRVEVSLKMDTVNSKSTEIGDFSSLHFGDTISGRIKRVELFGLFITIDETNMVGLCHKSELPDDHQKNIGSKYRVGDRVKAKILKVDEERQRISLGMKNIRAHMKDDASINILLNPSHGEAINNNDTARDSHISVLQESNLHDVLEDDGKHTDVVFPVLAEADSRASVLPLEVTLDDIENLGSEDLESQPPDHNIEADCNAVKNKGLKKKAKEERELEIMTAEQRLLDKDIPRTADDFEKLVRSSPNSSYVWIKYIAFMLQLADIEKARLIAERALRTINIREEAEKLNVWVAYFSLENEYGNPREEAVKKTFQRALQYCDPKKVHLALLGLYERTEQHKLADELLDQMIKKFKTSCKIWLRRVQSLLKQGQDGIQSIVKRALLSLPRNKHIKFISQSAILEFKCGVPDRGRAMFEEMLREYPKRTDLWSIYIDQEIRLGDADLIRALFERATCLSIPPKKMKFLFTKYHKFETSFGDEERAELVKKKAMDYVESLD